MPSPRPAAPAWQQAIYEVLKAGGIRQVAYVPDAGHAHVIRSVIADGASAYRVAQVTGLSQGLIGRIKHAR